MKLCLALSLLTVLTAPLSAQELTAAATMDRVRQLIASGERLEEKERAATAEARERKSTIEQKVSQLQRPYAAERVEELSSQIEQAQQNIGRMEAELEVAKIETPEERAAKLTEANEAAKEASAAYREADAKFAAEREAMRGKQSALNQELTELLGNIGRTVEELGVAKVTTGVSSESGSATVRWADADGKTLAYLHVGFPVRTHVKGTAGKLADTYPIIQNGSYGMMFLVGVVRGNFSASKGEWRDEEKLKVLVPQLVDLSALDAFSKALAGNAELMGRVEECRKEAMAFRERVDEATKDARTWMSVVGQQRHELGQPYDKARVTRLEDNLRNQKSSLLGYRAQLSVATIEDPAARQAERKKLEDELQAARDALLEAGVALRKERVALDKEKYRVSYAFWELLDGVARTSDELGLVEVQIQARAEDAYANLSWRDARTKQQASAQIRLRPDRSGWAEPRGALASKYAILGQSDNSINLAAGSVGVNVYVNNTEWRGKEQVGELVQKLLDLAAIAAWPKVDAE